MIEDVQDKYEQRDRRPELNDGIGAGARALEGGGGGGRVLEEAASTAGPQGASFIANMECSRQRVADISRIEDREPCQRFGSLLSSAEIGGVIRDQNDNSSAARDKRPLSDPTSRPR